MATDGPTPATCDVRVYANGTTVFMGWDISSNRMEGWVKKVAALSGQQVDWFFVGGRAAVKALGDLEEVRTAIVLLRADYRALTRECCVITDGNDGKFM